MGKRLRTGINRREMLLVLGAAAATLCGSVSAAPKAAPDFWKTELGHVADAVTGVRRGQTRVLCRSAGGREIHLVAYGPKQPRRGTANYNSACAGRDPASYARKDGSG